MWYLEESSQRPALSSHPSHQRFFRLLWMNKTHILTMTSFSTRAELAALIPGFDATGFTWELFGGSSQKILDQQLDEWTDSLPKQAKILIQAKIQDIWNRFPRTSAGNSNCIPACNFLSFTVIDIGLLAAATQLQTAEQNAFERGLVTGLRLGSKRKRVDTDKTPASYAGSIIADLGHMYKVIRPDGHGLLGPAFLTADEHAAARDVVANHTHERHLVAHMTPLLRERLLAVCERHCDLVNSEEYPWIPQSSELKANLIAPDLFIAPEYLVSYRMPYNRAPDSGENASFGEFQQYLACDSLCAVLDGKVHLTKAALGDFVKYLEILTWAGRATEATQCKGLLFDADNVQLVKACNGHVTEITVIGWATPGSRAFIQNFLSSNVDDPWHRALNWACNASAVTLVVAKTSQLLAGQKKVSCILGVGAVGRVFKVQSPTAPTVSWALKVVCGAASCVELRRQYELTRALPAAALRWVIGVVEDSYRESAIERDPVEPLQVSSLLMATVGQPTIYQEDIDTPAAVAILRVLSELHALSIVHGDARYKNAVYVQNEGWKWIDLRSQQLGTSVGYADDVRTFLTSCGRELKEDAIERYATQAAAGWATSDDRLAAVQALF